MYTLCEGKKIPLALKTMCIRPIITQIYEVSKKWLEPRLNTICEACDNVQHFEEFKEHTNSRFQKIYSIISIPARGKL